MINCEHPNRPTDFKHQTINKSMEQKPYVDIQGE